MIVQCGRQIEAEEIEQIRQTVETFWRLSRRELAQTVCEHLGWHTVSGGNKVDACLNLLRRLEADGLIRLPAVREQPRRVWRPPVITERTRAQGQVIGTLSDIGPVGLRVVHDGQEAGLFNEFVSRYHYLRYKQPFGCHLRYFMEAGGRRLGCMLFSGAAKAMRARDRWIGWGKDERLSNLGFVVNNGRFLIFPWVQVRYLASHVLGKAVRSLVKDWVKRWGYGPVLLESFVDPRYFEGTCYRAAGFEYVGMTTGQGLVREGRSYQTSPKRIFVRPLVDNFRQVLCSPQRAGRASS